MSWLLENFFSYSPFLGKSAPRVLCGEERGITLRFASPNSSFTQPIGILSSSSYWKKPI